MSAERSSIEHEAARSTEDTETVVVSQQAPVRRRLSVDTWAVLVALVAALLVKLHILNTVKW